jgi:hypothetical protein
MMRALMAYSDNPCTIIVKGDGDEAEVYDNVDPVSSRGGVVEVQRGRDNTVETASMSFASWNGQEWPELSLAAVVIWSGGGHRLAANRRIFESRRCASDISNK